MPQMKPLLWLTQYFILHLIFIMFYMVNYYKISPKVPCIASTLIKPNKKWLW